LIVGKADLVAKLRHHPLARALRVDKSTLAALQATLLHYLRGEAEQEIPVWRMVAAPVEALAARAAGLAAYLRDQGVPATLVTTTSTVGGGSLPGEVLPTRALALAAERPDALAAALRVGAPPVVARIADGQLLLDPRTVAPEEDGLLLQAVLAAWRQTGAP
jgi:L-seryl-tRNA(Ser) seleniumtransferase